MIAWLLVPTSPKGIDPKAPAPEFTLLGQKFTRVDPAAFKRATEKNLTLYVEYPEAVPGLSIAAPKQAVWERLVVSREGLGDLRPFDAGAFANRLLG